VCHHDQVPVTSFFNPVLLGIHALTPPPPGRTEAGLAGAATPASSLHCTHQRHVLSRDLPVVTPTVLSWVFSTRGAQPSANQGSPPRSMESGLKMQRMKAREAPRSCRWWRTVVGRSSRRHPSAAPSRAMWCGPVPTGSAGLTEW